MMARTPATPARRAFRRVSVRVCRTNSDITRYYGTLRRSGGCFYPNGRAVIVYCSCALAFACCFSTGTVHARHCTGFNANFRRNAVLAIVPDPKVLMRLEGGDDGCLRYGLACYDSMVLPAARIHTIAITIAITTSSVAAQSWLLPNRAWPSPHSAIRSFRPAQKSSISLILVCSMFREGPARFPSWLSHRVCHRCYPLE